MARRNGITEHTVAEIQAGTGIDAQDNDKCRASDLGDFGREFIFLNDDTTTPDDATFTLEETGEVGRWRAQEVASSLIGSAVDVDFTALLDNTEENIAVTLAGVAAGSAYQVGIVSGLPADTSLELEENHGADTLNFRFINNSGATLTAGTIVVNVYQV